jgi:succinoglycan biosynthesis protein ExoW
LATVAVVIPFFQRKPGLLTRAIGSICCQDLAGSIDIWVVDDESPVDPANDVPAQLPPHVQVRIVRQKNGGPGAARNTGLDNVAADTRFIAFLDSDDEWLPGHLRNAVDALGEDLDFYFSNHLEPDSTVDEFTQRKLLSPSQHHSLTRGSNCFQFVGDMRDQIISANVIETSTVVYRRERLAQARFRPDYRNAFEDHLFWLDAVNLSRGIAFSSDVECQYGRGVSIWRSSDLGTEYAFPRIIDQLRFIEALTSADATTSKQAGLLRTIRSGVRRTFVAELLHRARRRTAIDWSSVAAIVRLDPSLLLRAPLIAGDIALKRNRTHGDS